MAKSGSQDPAVAAFVARLREFHEECGAPTYRSLATVSRRLGALYPDHVHDDRDLPALSVTAISEVLGGRRANLPTPGWVAAFVLSCQRRAYETMVILTDPGPETLPPWMTRLHEARTGTTRVPERDEPVSRAGGSGPRPEAEAAPSEGDTEGTERKGPGGPGPLTDLAGAERIWVRAEDVLGIPDWSNLLSAAPDTGTMPAAYWQGAAPLIAEIHGMRTG